MKSGRFGLRVVAIVAGCVLAALAARPCPAWGATVDDIEVKFEGGTVKEYIDALRNSYAPAVGPAGVNVVLMPGAESVHMPPLSIKGASFDSAMHLVRFARSPGLGGADLIVSQESELYVVYLKPREVAKVHHATRVWSLSDFMINGMGALDILAAVETALSIFDEPRNVKYHEETGLLIMRGPEAQIEAVDQVLQGIQRTMHSREMMKGAHRIAIERVGAARYELQSEEIELERLRSHLAHTEQYMEELAAIERDDFQHRSRLHEARKQLGETRRDHRTSILRLERARGALEQAEAELCMLESRM